MQRVLARTFIVEHVAYMIQVARVFIYQNLCLAMITENATPKNKMQLGAGRSEDTTGVVEAKRRLDTKIAARQISVFRSRDSRTVYKLE